MKALTYFSNISALVLFLYGGIAFARPDTVEERLALTQKKDAAIIACQTAVHGPAVRATAQSLGVISNNNGSITFQDKTSYSFIESSSQLSSNFCRALVEEMFQTSENLGRGIKYYNYSN